MPEVRKQKEPIAHLNEKKYMYGSNTRENPIKYRVSCSQGTAIPSAAPR